MSGNPPTIEWYIARDGAQHGPISDVELRKFIELGHLRATDLVWCAQFTEWRTGLQAFPESYQPKTAPPTAPVAAPPAASPLPAASVATVQPPATVQSSGWAEPALTVPVGPVPAEPVKAPFELGPHAALQASRFEVDEGDESYAPAARGWIGMATAGFAVLLIAAGLGWFAWQNRTLVSGASAIGNVITTAVTGSQSPEHFRTPPYIAAGESRSEIDASLQKIAVWRFLKREFADWYGEITGEVEKMRIQKQDERYITQYFVNVIVTLRRRNALAALQSSPEHLRGMAGAFVTNLKQLGSRDGSTCYAFITHGEASPFMIELSRTPAFAETLQKQMIAVFSGVVDARTSRKIHPNTRRTDYDALTDDLVKQRGWTQQDLATFSDPQKLSTTLPDKVCTLVQDWFAAQLAMKDAELQVRLLAESLKPLVGG